MGEAPIDDKARQESQRKREQFCRDLVHEFTNAVTAVMGYSELALHEMERSHPAREWLEKIKNHTNQLAFLVRKLTALSPGAKRVSNDEG
jgi:signal transduction histidine kinase